MLIIKVFMTQDLAEMLISEEGTGGIIIQSILAALAEPVFGRSYS